MEVRWDEQPEQPEQPERPEQPDHGRVQLEPRVALKGLRVATDAMIEAGVAPGDGAECLEMLDALEAEVRRLQAVQVELFDEIDQRQLFAHVGLFSAKALVQHRTHASGSEVMARQRVAKMLRVLPAVQAAASQGLVSTCNLRRLSQAHANERVRDQLIEAELVMLRMAVKKSALEFDRWLTNWVRDADEDGAAQANERRHEQRDAKLIGNDELGWDLKAWCASLQGTKMRAVFDAYIDAELRADWDAAVAEHGERAVHIGLLPRTDAQRRMDALAAIFERAACLPSADGDPHAGVQVTLNLVMDQAGFERALRRIAGATPGPDDSLRPDRRCETLDGSPVDRTEAVMAGLLGHVRRVVIGAAGVVTDMGRRQRLFKNSAALAVRLGQLGCYWPGCNVPISQCQIDHIEPWTPRPDGTGGGSTSPANGGGLCGRHNRLKETGYHVVRDRHGQIRLRHPDGHLIE